jgi:hypothetical protein
MPSISSPGASFSSFVREFSGDYPRLPAADEFQRACGLRARNIRVFLLRV